MPRETYVLRNGELVPKHEAVPLPREGNRFNIIPDIDPVRSPIDGTVMSTRRHIREQEKRHGVVHVGNDKLPWQKPEVRSAPLGPDLKAAMQKHGRY